MGMLREFTGGGTNLYQPCNIPQLNGVGPEPGDGQKREDILCSKQRGLGMVGLQACSLKALHYLHN